MLHQVKKLFTRNKEGMTGLPEKVDHKRFNKEIKAKLARIPEGQDILDFIEKNEIEIQTDYQMDKLARFEYRRYFNNETGMEIIKQPKILINPFMAEGDMDYMMHNLLHEVWHIKQHMEHVGRLPVLMPFSDLCHQTRMLEADAESFAVEMSYKYKEAGFDKAWYAAKRSCYGVMADHYEAAVKADPENAHNGYARRAAFDAWFTLRDLKHRYDKTSANMQHADEKFYQKNPNVYHEKRRLMDSEISKIGDLSAVNYLKLPKTMYLQHPHYSQDICPEAKVSYYSKLSKMQPQPKKHKRPRQQQRISKLKR